MVAPVLSRTKYLKGYLFIWLVITVLHFLVFYQAYDIPLSLALADSISYNLIYAGLGSGIWYLVIYNNPEKKPLPELFMSHIAGLFTTLVIMLSVSFVSVKYFLQDSAAASFIFDTFFYSRIFHTIFIYFLIVSLYYLYSYVENLRAKELDEANLNIMVKEAELNLLKLQIKPHFLFNSLNSIDALIRRDPEKAHKMILELSDFIRYTLKSKMDDFTTLSKELENLRHYLNIERIRFGEILQYQEDIHEECLTGLVPHLILQPLAENAVKHGVYESSEPITIHLSCKSYSDYFSVEMSNNYDPEGGKRKGEAIGIRNIRQRMRLIYGANDLVSISDDNNIFKVRVIFLRQQVMD